MPMSFPDLLSLVRCAKIWEFRLPKEDETVAEYRAALADHVRPQDRIESHEIRTGKGWYEWNDDEKEDLFRH